MSESPNEHDHIRSQKGQRNEDRIPRTRRTGLPNTLTKKDEQYVRQVPVVGG